MLLLAPADVSIRQKPVLRCCVEECLLYLRADELPLLKPREHDELPGSYTSFSAMVPAVPLFPDTSIHG